MNAIIGFTALLEKHADNEEKRSDYIAKIKSSSAYLLELINNVLEMARIESGKTTITETVWSIEQLEDTLSSVFEEDLRRKNLSFEKRLHIEHPYIWCDPTKLQEIFLNLISNAVKYTPEGGTITLTITELPSDKDGCSLFKVVVSDTGIGISPEFLPHIFEDFTREKNTTQSKIGGTGLGMPITKKLVELMNGTIEAESQPGLGTTFTLLIPHRTAKPEDMENFYKKASEPALGKYTGKRILLAEDNDLNAEISIEILSEFGLQVERAADGAICVDMVKKAAEGYYDLILMDIQMPNMDGYQATQMIRSFPDAKKDTPIVAMTANAFAEDRQNALDARMNGHIAKPIDMPRLEAVLSEILGQESTH